MEDTEKPKNVLVNKGTLFYRAYSKKYIRKLILLFGLLILWSAVAVPILLQFRGEGKNRTVIKTGFGDEITKQDKIDAFVTMMDLDLSKRKAVIFASFKPLGKFISQDNESLAEPITIRFGHERKTFEKGVLISAFTTTVPLLNGKIREYPIDSYDLYVYMYIKDKDDNPIPIEISLSPFSQSLKVARELIEDKNIKQLHFSIRRTTTTFVFVSFITVLMWALSVSLVSITWDAVMSKKQIPPPLLSLGVSMMFALPALRRSQPGVPDIGCLIDLIGFFWNMVFIALSSVTIIITWTAKWKKE